MRVGLALGAGGIVGAAWMIGALDALERHGGLRPAETAEILGTSVGSLVAVMVAAGVPTEAMAAYAVGESDGALEPLEDHDATAVRLTRLPLSPRPGSLSMALRARGGAGRLTGLLPRGVVSTEGIASLVHRVVGERWPEGLIRIVERNTRTLARLDHLIDRLEQIEPDENSADGTQVPADAAG